MKPELLIVSGNSIHSFTVREDHAPVNNRWHYHAELELIYFKKGKGTRFIGDSISNFSEGEMFLIGAYLPHYWRIDNQYFNKLNPENFCLNVIHFKENFLGESFWGIPENKVLRRVFEDSQRGLEIKGLTKSAIARLIETIAETNGPRRVLLLIEVLLAIAESGELSPLFRRVIKVDLKELEKKRINMIYDYAVSNMKNAIPLGTIAAVASLSPNSFCRYFKSITHKTFSQFITEIRIGNACKLLLEGNLSLKEICYECGFNDLAVFHKYFKVQVGKSPKQYQKSFFK